MQMAGDSSAQALGAWLHGAGAGAVNAAKTFHNWVEAQPSLQQGLGAFARGVIAGPTAAVVAPPAAAQASGVYPAAVQAHAAGQAMTANDIAHLGTLSAAARSVLTANSPKTLAAADSARTKSKGGDAAQPQGAPTFDQMLQAYSGANGGKISLREMSALADIAAKTTAPHHVPSIADIAGQRALDLGDQFATQKMQEAAKAGNKDAYAAAAQEQLDRYERIARARAIDPATALALGN
jgi:hypothetical protein